MTEAKTTLKRLDGLRVVLTGGTGVLGGAIACAFARQGASLALIGRKADRLKAATSELRESDHAEVLAFVADITNVETLRDVADSIRREWGGVDVLATVAGGHIPEAIVSSERSFSDITPQALRKVMDLNVLGTLVPCQVFSPVMRDAVPRPHNRSDLATMPALPSASIITISSMSAGPALTNVIGYGSAKAAVENATRWMAASLSFANARCIRVNAIAPGFIVAETNRSLLTKADGSLTPRGETIIARTPMRRFGHPAEIADAAVWLASSESSFVTGAVIPVDGGFWSWSGV